MTSKQRIAFWHAAGVLPLLTAVTLVLTLGMPSALSQGVSTILGILVGYGLRAWHDYAVKQIIDIYAHETVLRMVQEMREADAHE